MNKLLLFFLFSFLLCSSVSAMEIAVIHENKAVPGILVEIEDSYEVHKYVTDRNGKFFANLSEGYYWITIDVVKEEGDIGEMGYTYANEVYLVDGELNIIECEMYKTPGFGIILLFVAILGIIYLKKSAKKT